MSKGEVTRQYIIEKSAPVFNRKGYAGTSIKDLTAVTGLSKGSIYGNFADKDEVALAAFRYNVKHLHQNFEKDINALCTYKDKLLAYPSLYIRYYSDVAESGGCPILNTATEADDSHPVLKEHAREAVYIWQSRIIDYIVKGIATGEFRARGTDPEALALTIIATIEGAVMMTKLDDKVSNLNKIMIVLQAMIEASLE